MQKGKLCKHRLEQTFLILLQETLLPWWCQGIVPFWAPLWQPAVWPAAQT